ncbi:hypothetical protein ACFL38_01535 [Candidatus Omnitrophota bacterium]
MKKSQTTIIYVSVFVLLMMVLSSCKNERNQLVQGGHRVDLDNDGIEEIVRFRNLKVEVFNQEGKLQGDFDAVGYSGKFEFVDLSNDGYRKIAVWTDGKEGYSKGIIIYGFKNQQVYEIFKLEVNSPIEVDFYSYQPSIQVGATKWIWNGQAFVPQGLADFGNFVQ